MTDAELEAMCDAEFNKQGWRCHEDIDADLLYRAAFRAGVRLQAERDSLDYHNGVIDGLNRAWGCCDRVEAKSPLFRWLGAAECKRGISAYRDECAAATRAAAPREGV